MIDNIPLICYNPSMNEYTDKKADGFKGERYIVIPTEAFQTFANLSQVGRILLTDIGFFPKAEHHFRERKDGIEEYIYLYCTEGKGIVNIEGRDYAIKANEAFCIPRFKKHFYYACEDDPWSILWAHFKGEDTKYYPLDECRIIELNSSNATNRMLYLFDFIFRTLEGNYTQGNFIYISHVLQLILSETYHREKHNTTQLQNKYVTSVVRYMYKHLSDNLTLQQISEEFDLSKSYINAIFQKYTNRAPLDFYINLKMKEACKLLRLSDVYIYEVAQKLGYKDQYYFSRVFKKVIGVSPNEYKNSEYFTDKE